MRRRCAAAAAIHRKLRDAGIPFVEPDPRAVPMYLRCPIRVRSKPKLLDAAEKLGLDIAGWYLSPAHPLQGEALHTLGYTPGACPAAEEAFAHVVTLPTLPALRGDRLDAAVRIIQEAL
jgi:dTDP-4-amino-4,6-dideoxygalactose transaminase